MRDNYLFASVCHDVRFASICCCCQFILKISNDQSISWHPVRMHHLRHLLTSSIRGRKKKCWTWGLRLMLSLFAPSQRPLNGGLAHMVERFVRNEEAKGSIPLISNFLAFFFF
jgi:hypothetical protein